MNKNVMCVTVCDNTTNIGFYDVELGDNSIRCLKLNGYQTKSGLKIREVSDYIFQLQNQMSLDLIIIDCKAMGLGISDELENSKCRVPIYKAYINRSLMTEALSKMNYLIKENLLNIDDDINVSLDNFNITYNSDTANITLLKSDYDNVYANICILLSFGYIVLSDMFKIKKREKIETNLNEILRILVDDLHELKSPDVKEIEKLARLIDKVNYIRGQY